MKIKIILFINILLLLLTACSDGASATQNSLTALQTDTRVTNSLSLIQETGFKELNTYRTRAGLTALTSNILLTSAAQSHANYLIKKNLYTHQEEGKSPAQRIVEKGYPHSDIAEDIYAGDISQERSIEILFSNIYHRLTFLDFGFDEIGLGYGQDTHYQHQKVYTYELGRQSSRKTNTQNNPKILLWPYKNQADVTPVFYEERPDPLPECSVSGYPISIQFNPLKNEQITLRSFELKEENKTLIESKLLAHDGKLAQKEFVLMPLSRLKADTTYHVDVIYFEEDAEKTLKWSFHTKAHPYTTLEINKTGETKNIKSNKTYYLYLPPKDCNDQFSSYTYKSSKGVTLTERMIDNNTIMIKARGKGTIMITPDSGRKFTLVVG